MSGWRSWRRSEQAGFCLAAGGSRVGPSRAGDTVSILIRTRRESLMARSLMKRLAVTLVVGVAVAMLGSGAFAQ